ncbi:DUF2635 domain-containing protein [Bradyrhizobium sp. SZCCHNR1093]|uniref:DUF2635 domain-containing protein n=1 Tax=Bradyrhizobium sp. SZCCHNR1093 TaxID=3057368 RepID=UPI0028E2B878|nr:DUF2635 domain-containing protein [Bradyrhizobium sp. SZCCHNR1093]
MATNIFVKPVLVTIDGITRPAPVRDPVSFKRLDPAGEWKPRSQYWNRRLLQGDVIEVSPAQAPSSPPPVAVS